MDKTIILWRSNAKSPIRFEKLQVLGGHTGSISCLAVADGSDILVSGATDATVKVWQVVVSKDRLEARLLQTLVLQPRYFPLTLALSRIGPGGALILAVGGTKSIIQTFVAESNHNIDAFGYQSTLTGHEGWIRCLNFVHERQREESDILLASASQDKHIRLWRVRQEDRLAPAKTSVLDASMGTATTSLSNKAHRLEALGLRYSLTFEALILGHEDWIYTATWNRNGERLQLLSASADSSLAIWESDETSGVWICTTRLGEISAQKGSTSATGSTGGFWTGLWSPDGQSVVSLGRTGSWRLWSHNRDQARWLQGLGISGHVRAVKSIAWAKDGTYMLSTSSDQTTRLHAEWEHKSIRSWHEFSRPQIHGYDLNCIDTFGPSTFISGADEKLLRVFEEPAAIAHMLESACGVKRHFESAMIEAASVPVLGLSNKAVERLGDDQNAHNRKSDDPQSLSLSAEAGKFIININQPPSEDLLARQTLWPEKEKLYGHGYEISAVAASHDSSLVATACKASSIDHAVIRLFETSTWREVKPALMAHSLTVTCLRFSADDTLLLSVGRDRQWTVFERDLMKDQHFSLKVSNPKGHSRMVLGASWAPLEPRRVFATAGRDKSIKLWKVEHKTFGCSLAVPTTVAVTGVDFQPRTLGRVTVLAAGDEKGDIFIYTFDVEDLSLKAAIAIDRRYARLLL